MDTQAQFSRCNLQHLSTGYFIQSALIDRDHLVSKTPLVLAAVDCIFALATQSQSTSVASNKFVSKGYD